MTRSTFPLLSAIILGLLFSCSSSQKSEPPVAVLKGLDKKREQVPDLPSQPQLASSLEVKKIAVLSDSSLSREQKISWAREHVPPEARAIPKPTPPPPAGTPRGAGPEVPVLSQKSADSSSAQQRVSGRKSLGGEFSKQARARFHPRWRTQNWSKNFITKMKPEVLGGRLEKMAEEQGIQWVIYLTQKFDTLQKVSRKHYGTDRRWTEIYVLNYPKIKDWDKVLPEMELRLWP